jgi:hypothetical protein
VDAGSNDDAVAYLPGRDRALMESDGESLGLDWRPMGMSFPAELKAVRYGYLFAAAPLFDGRGGEIGQTIPAGTRVAVLDAGPWAPGDSSYRRLYKVHWDAESTDGFVDGSSLALITAEKGTLAAGVVPRHIVVSGGESDYSLLAIVDGGVTTLIDTSTFRFPTAFHPSGVLRVAIDDVNGNGSPEVVLEAETIASLTTLGTTPLQWAAWLRPRDGQWSPILLYDESYATDSGYSSTTTMRAYDASGAGMRNMVRLDTDDVLVSGEREFRTQTVRFYPWTGTDYRKAALQDLPQLGTVTAQRLSLFTLPGGAEGVLPALSQGDVVYVFDRSDLPRDASKPGSWWYDVVTSTGVEGWVSGEGLALAWIDPLKENRAVFLGEATPP